MSLEEEVETTSIASVHIHVARAIEGVKNSSYLTLCYSNIFTGTVFVVYLQIFFLHWFSNSVIYIIQYIYNILNFVMLKNYVDFFLGSFSNYSSLHVCVRNKVEGKCG